MTPEAIREARHTLGLSAPDLAAMLGISGTRARQTVSEWEHGKRRMDDGRARLLTAYLEGYRPADWPHAP